MSAPACMWTEALTLAREGIPVFCTSAESALVDPRLRVRAAHSVVDALMYSLRRGIDNLAQPDTQRRLSAVAEDQLEAVCLRVQTFQPKTAEPWSADDVDLLISAWRKFREQH